MIRSNLQAAGGHRFTLLAETAITTAVTGTTTTPITKLAGMKYLVVQGTFAYTSGGTNAKFWVQTSIDGGTTWMDIICLYYTTADKVNYYSVAVNIGANALEDKAQQDGALEVNGTTTGLLGDRLRLKYTTTGTYVGTTIKIDAVAKA